MQLTQLVARNFRNFAALDLELPPEGVVVIGPNGHGKTNLLEAIYYLVLFRSLRGAKDRELVRFEEDGFFIAGTAGHRVTVGYEVAGRRKKVTIDRGELKKLADGVGSVVAVALSPADRTVVAGGPAGRRRYLDILLALSEPGYLASLSTMRQALKQRNAALRRADGDAARAFDAPFATSSAAVAAARRRWTARWAARYRDFCLALGETESPAIDYAADHHREIDSPTVVLDALDRAAERDARRGVTTVGPHRDDLTLVLNGKELRTFGSAGQQRTAAVALRLVEAETIRETRGVAPIALYDDVFAEFDEQRQANLLALIRETLPGQAVIAAPRESEVPASLLDRPRWSMRGGTIER